MGGTGKAQGLLGVTSPEMGALQDYIDIYMEMSIGDLKAQERALAFLIQIAYDLEHLESVVKAKWHRGEVERSAAEMGRVGARCRVRIDRFVFFQAAKI